MTKKDYELIAASIKRSVEDMNDFNFSNSDKDAVAEAVHHIIQNLGTQLSIDNERFSYGRFLQACGVVEQPQPVYVNSKGKTVSA